MGTHFIWIFSSKLIILFFNRVILEYYYLQPKLFIINKLLYILDANDVNFGNNTMAAVPLKENPSNGNGHWSAYVMNSDDVGIDIVSVRVSSFKIPNKYYLLDLIY